MKIFVQNIRIKYFSPGPPEFTEELRMRQETDGVLLESFLIYEPEHQVPAGEAIKKNIKWMEISILYLMIPHILLNGNDDNFWIFWGAFCAKNWIISDFF